MPEFNASVQDPVNYSQSNLNYGELSKCWQTQATATLFIFSPRCLSAQFVRPYVFNFNENLIDELVSRQFDPNIFNGGAKKSDAVLNAILPTSFDGIYQVRNQELSYYYTFMLVIQRMSTNASPLDPFLRAPNPSKRQIISGYFLQEPYTLDPWGGKVIMNPNAMMVFTHDSVFHVSPADMVRGNTGLINMNRNADNVSRTTEQMVVPSVQNGGENGLYMMRPMDLDKAADLTAQFPDTGTAVDGLANASLASVTGTRGGSAAVPLACSLKAPVAQLNHICDAARNCMFMNLYENSNTNSFTSPFIPSQDDPRNFARHTAREFSQNLMSADLNPMTIEGRDIDTSIPMTIANLDQMFGSGLIVMPCQTEAHASCDLTPQDEITSHKSVMSSMLASTLSSMLPAFNIGGIGFSYYSYKSPDGGISQRGVWQLQYVDPLIPNIEADGIDRKLQASVQMFYRELENNLFPILKNAGGDFELHADINSFSVSLINLTFMDERGMCAAPNGYWETDNCFNNFTNPLLAGKDIATRNVNSLASFKAAAVSALCNVPTITDQYAF